jgi:hypothetical protein
MFANSLDIASVSVSVLTTLLCVLFKELIRAAVVLDAFNDLSLDIVRIIRAVQLINRDNKVPSPNEVSYCCQIKF